MCFGCLGECIGKDSCGHTPSHDGHWWWQGTWEG
jgi:hypothetical protein